MRRRTALVAGVVALSGSTVGCLWRRGSLYATARPIPDPLVSLFNKTDSERVVALRLVDDAGTVHYDDSVEVPGSGGNAGTSFSVTGPDPGTGTYTLEAALGDDDTATRTWTVEDAYEPPQVLVTRPETVEIWGL